MSRSSGPEGEAASNEGGGREGPRWLSSETSMSALAFKSESDSPEGIQARLSLARLVAAEEGDVDTRELGKGLLGEGAVFAQGARRSANSISAEQVRGSCGDAPFMRVRMLLYPARTRALDRFPGGEVALPTYGRTLMAPYSGSPTC